MANTVRETCGQGSLRINDTVFHDLTETPIDQIEILEDSTDFTTVQLQTKDPSTLLYGVDQQIAGTGIAPNLDTGHGKGEFISLKSDFQRITGITLASGSITVCFA